MKKLLQQEKLAYIIEKDINIFGNVEVEENNYVKCDELFLDIKNSTSIMKSATSKKVEVLIVIRYLMITNQS